MRGLTRHGAAAIALLSIVGLLAILGTTAAADGIRECPPGTTPVTKTLYDSQTGMVTIVIVSCAKQGGGPAGFGGSEGDGPATCRYEGETIPCVKNGVPWLASQACYADQLPDPPTGSPEWQGHDASEGHIWYCAAGAMAFIPQNIWFVPNGRSPVVDPVVLARKALGELQLATAKVETAPAPPNNEVVGVEVWMWVPPEQWRDLSGSVSLGPTRVTVTATPDHVGWDMGDGTSTTCFGPGRAWLVGMTDAAQTTCGYTYKTISADEPGGVFQITAEISYRVDWTCQGVCATRSGTLGQVQAPAGEGQIKSVQRQTVVVN